MLPQAAFIESDMGAGFYDNYFQDHQGHKIGIVHQLLKDLNVEMNEFDIPMDVII